MKWLLPFHLLLLFSCGVSDGTSPTLSTSACEANGYYVSNSGGSDSNAGTTSCTPWKTLSKVANSTFSSSTTIHFKKGDTWYEGLSVPSNNLSLGSYGSGANPIFDGSESVSSWTSEGSNIYSFATGISASEGLGNLSRNGTMLTFVNWNTDASTTLGSSATNSYSYDNSADTLYLKSTTDPSSDSFRFSKIYKGISAEGKSNINISGITLTRFSLHAVEFKNCTNCDISNSTVTQTGGATIGSVYAGNGIEYGNSCSNGDVDNVTVSEIFDSCLSPQTYSSSQTISQVTFKNSTVSKCGFSGVEISVLSNGGTTGSSISNVSIENVSISDTGRGWSGRRYGTEGDGIRVKADSGAGAVSGTTVERTTINNAIGEGIKVNGDTGITTISRSKIKGGAIYGINFAESTSTTPKLVLNSSLIYNNGSYGIVFNCPNCQGINLYQNTFYNNTTINVGILGQDNEALVKNNIFYSSASMTHFYVNGTLTGGDIDYNCYNDTTNMFGYNSSTYSTVSAMNGATGFETNGIGNGTVGLTDPTNEDFTLTSSSSCKALGTSGLGISLDYNGSSFSSPPSAGAIQF